MRVPLRAVLLAVTVSTLVSAVWLRPQRVGVEAQVKIVTPTPTPKPTPKPSPSAPAPRPRPTPHRQAPEIEMVYVPGGSFLMGSPDGKGGDDEHPQHRVTVPSFYIGKYEVTQAQWRAVMGVNPSNFKGDNLPVENVSWNDAKEFCRRLSQMTGKEYRLPTEAEWEYACRAGTTGDYAGELDAMAWYNENSGGKTHPVGQKQPNAFGLYDMHGNVWEWCQDVYHDNYSGAPADGSAWMSGGHQDRRVLRGGSWDYYGRLCRAAHRGRPAPDDRRFDDGFRVVGSSRTP